MSKIYDEYLRLKEVDNSKLYLFRCGKFYIFIGEDCDFINEFVVLKKVRFTSDIYKCGFPLESLNDYLRVFKNQNLNIEVVESIDNFSGHDKNLNILKDIDINNITPVEALNILKKMKDNVR